MFRRSIAAILLTSLAAVATSCGSGAAPLPAPQTAAPAPSTPAPTTPAPSTPAASALQEPAGTAPPAPPAAAEIPPAITDADLPPLPITGFPAARPMEVVRAVFTFAAKHPEVLNHVPCFCGCQAQGHRNNDDCFVAARDARGRPTAWEPHGLGCGVCIDVARDAMQMHASGAGIAQIRHAIELKYRAAYGTMTPTPPVR